MNTIKITLKLLDIIASDNYHLGDIAIVQTREKRRLKIYGIPENTFDYPKKLICFYTSIGRIEIGDCFHCTFDSMSVKMDNSALYHICYDDITFIKNIGSADKNE